MVTHVLVTKEGRVNGMAGMGLFLYVNVSFPEGIHLSSVKTVNFV